jgi:secreted trypsin-like serine protease
MNSSTNQKIFNILILLIFIVLLQGCGAGVPTNQSDLRIVGGDFVSKDSPIARLSVSLVKTASKRTFCSGVLVADDIVLTAAHCVARIDFDVSVTRGVVVSRSKAFRVRNIVIHAEYNEANMYSLYPQTPTNDLAALYLDSPIPLTKSDMEILKSSLAPQSDDNSLSLGDTITLVGYGITSAETREGAGRLRSVESSIVDLNNDAGEFTFGGHPGKSACSIDSGGPAFVTSNTSEIKLVGISSRGTRDCLENGVYTNLSTLSHLAFTTVVLSE